MHFWDGMWGAHMGWMTIFWALGFALILALIVYFTRSLLPRSEGDGAPPPDGPFPEDRAERILRERYARGEIDDREYTRRREELRSGA